MPEIRIKVEVAKPVPEARYAYYRRCQVFRKNGEQCKAPAEKGAHICYAHACQQRTALRRKIELAVLLAEVVRRMRERGRSDFELEDIFMDFNAIQVTLGVMAQAVISGRIDCKTAGRLAIGLQTAAKLLELYHRVHRETQRKESLTTKDTKKPEEISGDLGSGRSLKLQPQGLKPAILLASTGPAPPQQAKKHGLLGIPEARALIRTHCFGLSAVA